MRRVHFDPSEINVSEDWKQKVREINEALIAETDPTERAKIIDNNSDVWREVKPELKKIFHRKCWYTEAPQQGTDVDIDHFRPKKRVNELINSNYPHNGYWWLAFDMSNFRYSCIIANRRRVDIETGITGGKADHFPIFDESKRARTPTCDIDEELPLLLDPCKASDVRLLLFNENGETIPRYNESTNPISYLRAKESIEYYHLNHDDFVKSRLELRSRLEKLRKQASLFFKKLESEDAFHHAAWENVVSDIQKLIDEKSPYSAFCKAYLDNYKYEDYMEGVLSP